MTDLEMTKLCAEAMGLNHFEIPSLFSKPQLWTGYHEGDIRQFDPLNDDRDAMALTRVIGLDIVQVGDSWEVGKSNTFDTPARNPNLNRAIVECVAKLRATSTSVEHP